MRLNQGAPLGVYIHFPWCLSKCPYCDFVVQAAPRASIDHEGYADAIVRELTQRASALSAKAPVLRSIFIGGGTPSLWRPSAVERVLRAVTSQFGASIYDIEISLESDPSALDEDVAAALRASGVNRLSIGLQSLDDERLRFLGRIHSAADGRRALAAAERAGMPRVSADLMYAVPGQTPLAAAREACELAELGATHVSAYSLTIEPGTPFGSRARRGRLPLYDDGEMTESFFAIDEALSERGLQHYEVSNYARPQQEAQHNVGYWTGRDYLGLGCGAYGTLRETDGSATRYRNDPRPKSYVERVALGELPSTSVERLDAETLMRERIMLGLRMRAGIDLAAAAQELGVVALPEARAEALARLVTRGRLVRDGLHVKVPRSAWIWVDETASALF
jgi:putative oxygen-independent coproporphyrinogen III oxidase